MKKIKKIFLLSMLMVMLFTGCGTKNNIDTQLATELETAPSKSLYIENEKGQKVYNCELSGKVYNESCLLEWNNDDKHKTFYIYLYNKNSQEYIFQTESSSNRITLTKLKNELGEYISFKNNETYEFYIFCDKNQKEELANNHIKITYYSLSNIPKSLGVSYENETLTLNWDKVDDIAMYGVYAINNNKSFYAKQCETQNTTVSLTEIINNKNEKEEFVPGENFTFIVITQNLKGEWEDISKGVSINYTIPDDSKEEEQNNKQ